MFELIQLPNDVRPVRYQRSPINPYQWDQVWHSKERDFTGTELEFLAAGHGYRYLQVGTYRRLVVK
jgi:hypothetical protein